MDSRFAQNELSKRGWREGKGLGRSETGMKDAIKVKHKSGMGGLGHNLGDEFTFHWWDHIFNKAANSIKVDEKEGEEGVTITTENQVGPVSFKKPLSRNMQGKELMYGMFVKAGTYTQSLKTTTDSDDEDPFAFSSDSEDSANEEDLSCKDTLEKTFKMTGMTGHKGARHGQTMSGKLSRIMKQESNSNTPVVTPQPTPNPSPVNSDQDDLDGEPVKKKKKKKQTGGKKTENEDDDAFANQEQISTDQDETRKKKKKKKCKLSKTIEEENALENSNNDNRPDISEGNVDEHSEETVKHSGEALLEHSGTDKPNKKKKKKKKKREMDELETGSVEHETPATVDIADAVNAVNLAVVDVVNAVNLAVTDAVNVNDPGSSGVEQTEKKKKKKRKKKKGALATHGGEEEGKVLDGKVCEPISLGEIEYDGSGQLKTNDNDNNTDNDNAKQIDDSSNKGKKRKRDSQNHNNETESQFVTSENGSPKNQEK